MKIKGIHHIKLTVSNLKRSVTFYSKLPGFRIVAEYPGFTMFHNGKFYLGLTDHKEKVQKGNFNEFNVGLDHFCLEVDSHESLNEALELFEKNDIAHGEIKKLSNNVYVLAFRDPDNIQLELGWSGK